MDSAETNTSHGAAGAIYRAARNLMSGNSLLIMNGLVVTVGLLGCAYGQKHAFAILGYDQPEIYQRWYTGIFWALMSVLIIRIRSYSFIVLIIIFYITSYFVYDYYFMEKIDPSNPPTMVGFYIPDFISFVLLSVSLSSILIFAVSITIKKYRKKGHEGGL